MGDTSRQTEEQQRPLSQAEQAQAIARGMVERSSHLLANGVSPTLVLIWEWLWAEAQFKPATITIRIATLAEERGGKSRQAAMDNLQEMLSLGVCPIVEGQQGRGGGTTVAVEDPFHVFTNAPRRVEVPPQNEFPFVAELAAIEAEAEQERISGEAPSVVAIGTAQVKCNPEASQGYICEVERGDHASLPALLADEVAREIGQERFDLWLGNCSIEWRSPRLNLRCPTDLHARMVRGNIADAIRAAGRVMLPDFELTIDVESSNVTLTAR